MSVSCLDTTKEAKENQKTLVEEKDKDADHSELPEKKSVSSDEVSKNENASSELTPGKKRKLSPTPRPSKSRKYNVEDDALQSFSSTSDLSAGSTNERDDSSTSGSKAIVDNTTLVVEHYNALQEKSLFCRNQSRIVYMRNFNNWVKSMLINAFTDKIKQDSYYHSSLTVLDICCGKGGDLLKWKKSNVSHLVCADIAQVSVEQCEYRYNEILKKNSNERSFSPLFKAEFITADCTKVHLRERYKDPSIQFDLVSCQFAFHYSFETVEQAECMLRNASENLKPGGYFIGTMPDAYDLVSRWQKSEGNKFGNDVYSVEFLCEDKEKPPLFGAKYNFHLEGVVDCPEFLVYLPTLCKLASKFGLELVMSERFDNYYEHMKDKGRSLLFIMKALETYSTHREASLVGNPSKDYQHVQQYLEEFPGNRQIRTLSESEWEVISLYIVFAFRKTKHSK